MPAMRLDSMLNRTQRKTLCCLLAAIVGVCAVMVAIPGIFSAIADQPAAMSNCHLQIPGAAAHDNTVDNLSPSDTSAVLHEGSSTVCSGDFLLTQLADNFVLSLLVLGAVFYVVYTALKPRPLVLQHHADRRHLPLFSDQIRSHLGIGRIHV